MDEADPASLVERSGLDSAVVLVGSIHRAGIPSMPAKKPTAEEHRHYHKDGSLWAKGPMIDGVATGYWEWYRKDGTKLRSGSFEDGEQVGQWTTYDKDGKVYKVTTVKPRTK